VLERLPLAGSETVLDAGCGSGRVTEALLERLPRGRVIAVDADPSMISAARERLGKRAEIRQSDLLELELPQPVDAILSTATFHWILDHPRLFVRLHTALGKGGRLVAQCGGEGNITHIRAAVDRVAALEPFAPHLSGWRAPLNYSSPQRAEQALSTAGFEQIHCWLAEAPVVLEEPHEFLATIILGAHRERLPAERREEFIAAVVAQLPAPVTVDYVRLNIDAVA
jgi:trans-aconitate 2-methyltransferase